MNIGNDIDNGIKICGLFRDYIKHEDDLVNHRLTWLLTIHGFLYATCGFTLQARPEVAQRVASDFLKYATTVCPNLDQMTSKACIDVQRHYFSIDSLGYTSIELDLFLFMLALVGIAISFFGLRSIRAAVDSSVSLRRIFSEQYEFNPQGLNGAYNPRIFGAGDLFIVGDSSTSCIVPSIAGGGSAYAEEGGFTAPNVIPWILIAGWIIALFSGLIYLSTQYYIWRVLF